MNKPSSDQRPYYWYPIIGILITNFAYQPGFFSPDSLVIYQQAITHQYGDWHPPAMAWLWSLLNKLSTNPKNMLLLQLGLLWGSYAMLAASWFSSHRSRFLLFLVFLLAPFIQNFAGFIIKDAQMALCWLLAVCIIADASYHKRRMGWFAGPLSLLLILYGTLVRINALPGALFLFFYWADNYFPWRQYRVRTVTTIVLLVLLVFGAQYLLMQSLKPQKEYPEYKLYLHDIAGIYVKSGQDHFPAFVKAHPGFDTAYLKANYTTATLDNLYWNEEHKFSFPALDEATEPLIRKAWKESITAHPGTYLANHWDGFLYFLRIKKRTWFVTQHALVTTNDFGISYKPDLFGRFLIKAVKIHSGLPWMRPWFWLLMNLVMLFAGYRMAAGVARKAILVLTGSSLAYLLAQFFIFQVDTEFRYFYWNCLAVFVSMLIWGKVWWDGRKSRSANPGIASVDSAVIPAG
ncbi:MAG: hypothetical protein P0Y53_19165 [Candidatus Pseudobacter hemicellulosilyticus]|uniref:Uncharacterized protein n=1 Tax=Candidatus Pseudobacter hemicellulosilyticus TaxID=3121375 RepID=A0AAJ6BFT8_9BACT|nr:MAG: hypothetical protein P0Y53_19165 [Pseudobacter sp.]